MTSIALLVFLLGLRHGLDPDHLVAIDGMTRSTRSRWCGLFFSLGHGTAVTLIGVAVAIVATEWQAPQWLEHTGALVSVAVLLALGIANLAAVLRTPAGAHVALIGLRGRWLSGRFARASHPAVIASVGAAFAVSFDTVSHALAFSLAGATMAGALFAAVLGIIFTLGMMLTDALNGLWVARMMTSTARASRWTGLAVALLCLFVSVLGAMNYVHPDAGAIADSLSLPLALGSVLLLTLIAAGAMLRSRSAYREAGS